ncbi:hypothetical protein GCM10009599_07000 [Luteococcus peritonei]
MTELRLRDVRGDAIGDAVAEVESHCQEAGETPQEMFGDPRDYARRLAFPEQQMVTRSAGQWLALLAPMLLGGLGLLLAGPTGSALAAGRDVQVSWGELASLLLMCLFAAGVVRWTHAIVQQRLRGILFFTGAVTVAAMLPPILLTSVAVRLPVTVAAVLAIALQLACLVGMYRRMDDWDDPLVDPRGSTSPVDRHPAVSRAMIRLLPWMFPVAAAVFALMAWVVG